jgi:hypothetical protein
MWLTRRLTGAAGTTEESCFGTCVGCPADVRSSTLTVLVFWLNHAGTGVSRRYARRGECTCLYNACGMRSAQARRWTKNTGTTLPCVPKLQRVLAVPLGWLIHAFAHVHVDLRAYSAAIPHPLTTNFLQTPQTSLFTPSHAFRLSRRRCLHYRLRLCTYYSSQDHVHTCAIASYSAEKRWPDVELSATHQTGRSNVLSRPQSPSQPVPPVNTFARP